MRAELLRHRITFLNPPGAIVGGWRSTEWTEHVSSRAAIETLKGNRLTDMAAVQMQDMKTFIIRYRKDVDDTMRIRHKGKDYDITSMTNDDENNQWYTILVQEVL